MARFLVVTAALVTTLCGIAACSSAPAPAPTPSPVDIGTIGAEVRAEIAQYEKALAQNPRDGEGMLELAKAYRNAQRWADAKRTAAVAADLMPGNRAAQLFAAEMHNSFREFDDAVARLTPVLKNDPNDARALMLYALARAHLRTASDVLEALDSGWRAGRPTEATIVQVRVAPGPAIDREAEENMRRALQLASTETGPLALASLLCVTGRFNDALAVLKKVLESVPTHGLILRFLGSHASARGLEAEAEAYFRRAAENGDEDSVMSLATYYKMKGRDREALDLINRVASRDATGNGLVQAAEIELKLGMVDQAAAHIDSVLARFPEHPDGRVLRARVLLIRGQAAEAAALARSVTTVTPWIRMAHATLGRALWQLGDTTGSYEELVKAWRRNDADPVLAAEISDLATYLGKRDVAVEFAERRVQLDRGNPMAVVALAAAQLRAGRTAAAEKTLIALPPGMLTSADALLITADLHAALGRKDAARAAYTKVLQATPDSLAALAGLLNIETASGELPRVRAQIDQAAARHANAPPYLILAARAAAMSGDTVTAETRLRAALAIDSANVDAATQLSRLYANLGRSQEARQLLETLLARSPGSAELQFELAGVLEQTGALDEARKRYEETLRLNPSMYRASARLAALIVRQNGNLDMALQFAQSAKQGLSTDPEVDDTLGWILVLKRRASAALPHLEAAVKASPNRAEYRYHLGAAYDQMGQIQEARRELQRALQINPSFTGAAEAKKLLAAIGG